MSKFDVEIEQELFTDEYRLSVTHNGYHWTAIRLAKDELCEVSKCLRDFIEDLGLNDTQIPQQD